MNVETYWSHSFLPELVRPTGVVFDFGVNGGGFSELMSPRCRVVIGLCSNVSVPATLRAGRNDTPIAAA